MSNIPNKIRFCCLPVLPTVFSDGLSNIEVLSKLCEYINQMIEALKQQDVDIAKIQEQVDTVDPSNYIQTSGGTLTGPLFFIDNAHVLKNEDGTITLSGTGLMNLHGGGNVTIDTPESIAIRADKSVDITGSTDVEILTGQNGTVNIEGGSVAITGDINVHGTMRFDQTDTLDARGAGVLVDEPQVDGAPVNLKYFNEHKGSGGVTCGYITVAVDDSKTTVDVHSENLIPKGELGGYYVDNAGNLWHATQVVAGGFTLENQNINVLANAEFVRITGNTSVNNITVNDTGSSRYQAAKNIGVVGEDTANVFAIRNRVDIGGPAIYIEAENRVDIYADNGKVTIGNAHSDVDMSNSAGVMVPTPVNDSDAATKLYVDQHSGVGLKLAELNGNNVYIPASAFKQTGPTTVWVNVALDSSGTDYALGVVTMNAGSIAYNNVLAVHGNSASVATLTWQAGVGLVFDDSTIDGTTYIGGVYAVVN